MLRLIICIFMCSSMLSCSSKDGKNISSSKIQTSVQKCEDVNYDGYVITGDLNLIDIDAAIKTSPGQYCNYIKSGMVFIDCTFKGKLIGSIKDTAHNAYTATFFKNLYFENCTFEDEVNIEGATINGFCNFLNCTFKKEGLFNRVSFAQTTAFTKCSFEQMAGFQSCTFNNSAFYNETHFSKECFFQNSFFYRDFTFSLVVCDGYTDFSSINFYSVVHCNYAKFFKDIVFDNGSFRGRTEFVDSKFTKAEFDGSIFYALAIFEKSEFTESLSVKDCKFLSEQPHTSGYKAGKIDISGCQVIGLSIMKEF